ncbi:MAG: phage tail tape measure protein [Sporolactobacillus sp.]
MAFDLTARLILNGGNFVSGLRAAQRQTSLFGKTIGTVTKGIAVMVGGASLAAAGYGALKKTMSFDQEIHNIGALGGMTSKQMDQIRSAALKAGAQTQWSASESAQGVEELAKAGMSTSTILKGGLTASLNLATAGGMNLADTASLMSNAMNAFRGTGLTAAKTANILAGAANASSADMIDLKYGLASVGPVSANIGMGLRDTSAALALFSNYSLSGADAGTSLKTMLLNLSPQTDKAAGLMKQFGIITKDGANQFFNAQGEVKGLAGVADVLSKSLDRLNPKQRSDALKQMFGQDAVRAGGILFKAGADGVDKMYKAMGKVTALDVAKQKMNSASGAVETFKGAMETLQISVLTPLLPVIKNVANGMANWVASLKPGQIAAFGATVKGVLNGVVGTVKSIVANWGTVSSVIIGAAVAIGVFKTAMLAMTVIGTITKLMYGLRVAYMMATGAQIAMNVAMDANPIGAVITVIALLTAGIIALIVNWHAVASALAYAWNRFVIARNIILTLLGPIGGLIAIAALLISHWHQVGAVWANVWNGIKVTAANAINGVISKINALINFINKIPGVSIPLVPKVDFGGVNVSKSANKRANATLSTQNQFRAYSASVHSHAGGLSNVPYNQYAASLHKGERVLTRSENDAYSNGSKRAVTVTGGIQLYGVAGNIEQAADKLLDILATKVEAAGNGGA